MMGDVVQVEPGTNPGFLYQQNTLRDAVAAGTNLNIFNNHSDRVRMANIAQVVNVLQAMILTEGKEDASHPDLPCLLAVQGTSGCDDDSGPCHFACVCLRREELPSVNCSASIDGTGEMHISLCNIDPDAPADISMRLDHFQSKDITGQILTAERMNAHNTFEDPDVVRPARFSDFKLSGGNLSVALPPMSVVVLAVKGELRLEARPPITLKSPLPGLQYKYYETDGVSMPAFAALTPAVSGAVDAVVYPKGIRDSNFGFFTMDTLRFPEKGIYTFYANSDDGSALLIDGRIVVNNDGRHAPIERSVLSCWIPATTNCR